MGDTSLGQTALIREVTPGVTPATPAFKLIDIVSEDFKYNRNKTRSNTVTPQRAVRSSKTTSTDNGGSLNIEFYQGDEIDMLIEDIMGNPFASNLAKGGGSVVNTYTMERKLSATDYRRFTGWRPGQLECTIQPEQIITGKVTGLGYSMVTGAAAISGSTYAAPSTNEKLTALDVAAVTLSNGLSLSLDYEQINFTLNNQLALRRRVGPNTIRRIAAGMVLVTGQLRAYVDDKAVADAFIADTQFDMSIPMVSGGKGYTFAFQNVTIVEDEDPNTGNNNDFISTINFEATLDLAYGASVGVTRAP